MKSFLGIFFAFLFLFTGTMAFADDVYVRGYTKSNGTYVQPHYRSAPDGNVNNNWSTRGNVNPYTGAVGTRDPSPSFGTRSYDAPTPRPSYGSQLGTGNSLNNSNDSTFGR